MFSEPLFCYFMITKFTGFLFFLMYTNIYVSKYTCQLTAVKEEVMTCICQRQPKFERASLALNRLVHFISWPPWATCPGATISLSREAMMQAWVIFFFPYKNHHSNNNRKSFFPTEVMPDHARKVGRHCHVYQNLPRLPWDRGGWAQGRELQEKDSCSGPTHTSTAFPKKPLNIAQLS